MTNKVEPRPETVGALFWDECRVFGLKIGAIRPGITVRAQFPMPSRLDLTERCKQVAILRFVHRMEQFEIAEALDMAQPTVSRHLSTAIGRYPSLKRFLTPTGRLAPLP